MQNRQGTILLFLCALALAGILLLTVRAEQAATGKRNAGGHPAAEIAVENERAATLTLQESAGKNPGIVECTAEGSDMYLSVPSSWERREVRGAALSTVTADPPALGFTRWHLPEGVTLSFRVPGSPALTVRHASSAPLLIIGKRVDLGTGKVEEKSVLMQEGEPQLW